MTSINGNCLGLCEVDDFRPWEKFKLDKDSFVVDLGARSGEFSEYILNTYDCRVDAYDSINGCRLVHPKFRFFHEKVNGKNIKNITKEPISLMKVNIEGDEIETLMKANLKNVDQLIVEFHVFNGFVSQKDTDKVVKKILSYGYKSIRFGDAPAYFFYEK